MLSVVRVHLPSEIPIVGCELTPYVLLRRPDKTISTDDVSEIAPLDGHFLRYKWLRAFEGRMEDATYRLNDIIGTRTFL
ncbi:hypothetical protein LR48_Vigan02g022400 [Vigna angularis]|uniref:Uncharacterized protein n=1 Tax=Phaseolus angularis TaxID=3914 RepID=A0A0L9TV73_PHAAN|nr:hypothetical protein LR48_Vigan02g022400 [Vigna angularis]